VPMVMENQERVELRIMRRQPRRRRVWVAFELVVGFRLEESVAVVPRQEFVGVMV
jgi:hypothetical protein